MEMRELWLGVREMVREIWCVSRRRLMGGCFWSGNMIMRSKRFMDFGREFLGIAHVSRCNFY